MSFRPGRMLLTLGCLALLAPATPAAVEMTLDAASLTQLLSVVAPPKISVGMAPGATVDVRLEDVQVTGFDPKANAGLGHLLTKVRLVAPAIGLDTRVEPRVSLEITKKGGLAFCNVKFEKVEVPMPWGSLDAAPLLPAVPVRADHVFEIVTQNGSAGLRSRLVDAKMSASSLKLVFDLDITDAADVEDEDEPAGE